MLSSLGVYTLNPDSTNLGEPQLRAAGRAAIRDHLPPEAHPNYVAVLTELARVQLEHDWVSGRRPRVEIYIAEFPELRNHPDALALLAFEEYRQRVEFGERPDPLEYAERYGVKVSGWEIPDPAAPPPTQVVQGGILFDNKVGSRANPDDVVASSRAYRQFLADTSRPGYANSGGFPPAAGLFRDLHQSNPIVAARLADAVAAFPEVGSDFLGFRLVGELGRGHSGGCTWPSRPNSRAGWSHSS